METPSHLYEYMAEIVDVYDGDTVRADIDLGFNTWIRNESIRLFGLNAPEVRGVERPDGLISRDFLREQLAAHERVLLRTVKDKKGKYGRWLADILVWNGDQWESINQRLIDSGMAVSAVY